MRSRATVVVEESRIVSRLVMRTPALVFWLLAAVVWPLAYVLMNVGTTPLASALSLSSIPVGPLLWSLFGSRLTATDRKEIGATWPAPAGRRALGAVLALIEWSALGGLTSLAATLCGVEAGFWQPASFAITSLVHSLAMLLPTIVWWTAVGFALGSLVKGVLKTVLAVLAPAAMTVVTELAFGASPHEGASPLLPFVGLSTAGWFTGRIDAFGLGPWAAIFAWSAWLMVAISIVGLCFASIAGFGRQWRAAILLAVSIAAVVGTSLGLDQRLTVLRAATPPASAYHAGAKTPASVSAIHITLSVNAPPGIAATAALRFSPASDLSTIRFFLPTNFRVLKVTLDGKPLGWTRQGLFGWVSASSAQPLVVGSQHILGVSYNGNSTALTHYTAPNLNSFAANEGWTLPAGTWYPLLGSAHPGTHFRLDLTAPAGYLTVTPYGVVRGSTRADQPIEGIGETLSLVGGHLAPFTKVGAITMYAAADQTQAARNAFSAEMFPGSPSRTTGTEAASCFAETLRPRPVGAIVWAVSPAGQQVVLTPDDRPWQPGPVLVGGANFNPLGLGAGPSYMYPANLTEVFGPTVAGLWINGGRKFVVPQGGAEGQLLYGLVTACLGIPAYNGPVLDQVGRAIAALPRPELRHLTPMAYAAYSRGNLTDSSLAHLVQKVSRK